MKNWLPLSDQEYDKVWDRVYRDFQFKPSISIFPSFHVPQPFITYDVSDYFSSSAALDDLEEKALTVFKEITRIDEYILALDWQHECYWVNPYLAFENDEYGEWIVPIFPNGDYNFFIQKDFKWGYLGHPWERSITIFGHELIETFENHKPRMFHNILRQS